MADLTGNAGWLAVIAGAVISFLGGWLWYSPLLFGPKWAEGSGVEMGTASDMPFGAMAAQFAGLFLMSWFVGTGLAAGALPLVLLGTLAFAVLAYSGALFTKKSFYARNVDAGYWALALVLMIGVHSAL
ncbi:MAG: DUF1761 domain-containing protein [Hoeflea sp.]|uniref:DUF1761 domain-containing protein n=1 Tax=Hoeflea sp. TaxID=1940281 RepID=UPI0032EB1D15